MGNKIIEGFLSSNLKLTKYVKNFKHIASFSFLNKGKTGKFEIGYCKVPVRNIFILKLVCKGGGVERV